MAKPDQVLIIEPKGELRFRGPFNIAPITSYIKLTNPTKHKVYFKIKTTAPKRYCVRPNSGALQPNQVIVIAVCLQPYDFDPAEKSKHKFMVQTLIAENTDDEEYPNDVWKDTPSDMLMDSKLKCVFENPATTIGTTKTTSTTTTTTSDTNTTNGKNKSVGDSVKSSPKLSSFGEAEEKLMKAAQEVNQLRVEESTLRQENLQLKEDMLKWRKAALGNDDSLKETVQPLSSTSSSSLFPDMQSLIVGIAMVIVGYLLGKMI